MRIGRITLSDRASSGIYGDRSGPEIERVVEECFEEILEWRRVLIPDDLDRIVAELTRLADKEECLLILTTGGTGPSFRDVTPEATRRVISKELPGFGEVMRAASFKKVRTAILSRATAGVRHRSLILNLPGKPSAIEECLPMLTPAIAECLDHVSGFRPKLRRG